MTLKQEKVPCATCGTPTPFTGTKRCNNCWEVEGRLDKYLQSKNGRVHITKELRLARKAVR